MAKSKRRTVFRVSFLTRDGVWVVRSPQAPTIHFATKGQAVDYAVQAAKSLPLAQVVVHRKDGTIQEERTYPRSSDPRRSKG